MTGNLLRFVTTSLSTSALIGLHRPVLADGPDVGRRVDPVLVYPVVFTDAARTRGAELTVVMTTTCALVARGLMDAVAPRFTPRRGVSKRVCP